jgi:hypothetical protein
MTTVLNREELAKFLPDHKSIKAFEDLFKEAAAGSEVDVSVQEISIAVGSATATANQAIGGVVLNGIKAKSNGVLLWLSM